MYVVLVKKRDPISQKSFLDNISEVKMSRLFRGKHVQTNQQIMAGNWAVFGGP